MKKLIFCLTITILFFSTFNAFAVPVQMSFSGVISGQNVDWSILNQYGISSGDRFYGEIVYINDDDAFIDDMVPDAIINPQVSYTIKINSFEFSQSDYYSDDQYIGVNSSGDVWLSDSYSITNSSVFFDYVYMAFDSSHLNLTGDAGVSESDFKQLIPDYFYAGGYVLYPGGEGEALFGHIDDYSISILNPVPEPATLILLGSGLLSALPISRKRFSRRNKRND